MMNKKRLAVLAMSAVMAASTVSVPVGAADFSDGAAGAEAQVAAETADFSADVDTQALDVTEETPDAAGAIVFGKPQWSGLDTDTPSLTITVNGKSETYTKGFEKKETEAFCEQPGGYRWYIEIYEEPFLSDFVETEDALGHDWKEAKWVTTKEATCTETGNQELRHECNRCKEVEAVKGEDGNSITRTTDKKGHEIDPEAETTQITYTVGEDLNTTLDANGKPVLVNPSKSGTYYVTTSGVCKYCGAEIPGKPEEKELTPTIITENGTRKIIATENIKDNRISVDAIFNEEESFPKNDEIALDDCDKDGSYTYVVYGTDGEVINTITVNVKAHHIFEKVTDENIADSYEPVDKNDAGALSAIIDEDGNLIVTNNSCLKDVKYNLLKKCSVCEDVVKEEKVAPKSDRHTIDKEIQNKVQGYKDRNEEVNYSDLLEAIGGENSKDAKIVNVTATCDKAGTADVELYCQVCGKKAATISGVKVAELGHKFVTKAENVKEATCTSSGSYEAVKKCERCGKEESRKTIVVKRLAHTNETAVDINGNGTPSEKIKGSEASIQFVGSLVFGPKNTNNDANWVYEVNKNFDGGHDYTDKDGNVITDGTVSAKVVTNCAVCHKNEVVLKALPNIKVKAVTKETTNAVTGKVTAPGSITLEATFTEGDQTLTKEITLPYFSEPMDTTLAYTGLHKDVDGVYRYYVDGDFAEDYVGMVDFDGKEFYVENGVISTGTHGIKLVGDKFYFFAYGQVQDYTGIAQYDGEFFSVVNGKLNTDVSGLVDYDGGTFLFADGRLVKEHNGLWQNFDGDWYYLANGQVQKQYTGLALYDGEWFYVVKGVLAEDYTGTVEYDGAEFKVVNGMVQ